MITTRVLITSRNCTNSCLITFLFKDDPIFKPPEDDSEEDCYSSSNAGTGRALETLPRDKAIESIQAYDKIKSKLKDF